MLYKRLYIFFLTFSQNGSYRCYYCTWCSILVYKEDENFKWYSLSGFVWVYHDFKQAFFKIRYIFWTLNQLVETRCCTIEGFTWDCEWFMYLTSNNISMHLWCANKRNRRYSRTVEQSTRLWKCIFHYSKTYGRF